MEPTPNIIRPTFTPRPYQREITKARANGVKRGVSIIHRRAGKDLTMLNMLVLEATKRVGLYLYYFPTFALGKRVIWKGMDREGRPFLSYIPPELIKTRNETDLRLELINGSIIQILGTENLDTNVVGMNPVGVVFSEYPLQNPLAWELTRPILRENGGWAWFVYTPRGRNHGYQLYEMARTQPSWFHQLLTIRDTRDEAGRPIITPEEVEQEIREGMDPDLAQQEFYCSFDAPMAGSYYGKALADLYARGRVCPLAYDPSLPVTTGWDIGIGDATAIWFAQFGPGTDIRLIDYYENHSEGFEHYAEVVLKRPYLYDAVILPHDAGAREKGSGLSYEDLARKVFVRRGIKVHVLPRYEIEEGIQQVRRLFPRFKFDEERCGRIKYRGHTALDALASYQKKWNDHKQDYENSPHHNWASHCADALRTLALGVREVPTGRYQTTYITHFNPMVDITTTEYEHEFNPFTYEADLARQDRLEEALGTGWGRPWGLEV